MCNGLIHAILEGGRHDLLTCGVCGSEVPLLIHELYEVYFAKLEVENAARDAERAEARGANDAFLRASQSVAASRGRPRDRHAGRQPAHAQPHGG